LAGFGVGVALGSAWSYPYYGGYGYYPYPAYAPSAPAAAPGPYACGSWIWHPESYTYAWAPCDSGGPNVVVPPADAGPAPNAGVVPHEVVPREVYPPSN